MGVQNIANGMSIPLAQSGSLLLPDNIWSARYFANILIAPPLQALLSVLAQFLLTYRCRVQNLGWETPLLSESVFVLLSAQNPIEALPFLGKG